jgi:hypothetical protein
LAAIDALEQDAHLSGILPPYAKSSLTSFTTSSISKARSMFVDICPNVFSEEHNCSSPRSVNHMTLFGKNMQEACIEDEGRVEETREEAASPTEITPAFEQHRQPTGRM